MRNLVRGRLVWIPTVLVLVVVLVGGARLLYLNVRHHSLVAREQAVSTAAGIVRRIEPRLQGLVSRSVYQATLGTRDVGTAADAAPLAATAPAAGTFWMSRQHVVIAATPADRLAAAGVADEWKSADAGRPVGGVALLGPLRYGSEWLLASRAPILASQGDSPVAWAVAFGKLDQLLADSGLSRLLDSGYTFELSQVEPRSGRVRTFISTASEPLTDAVLARVQLAEGVEAVPAGSYLQLALRPRAGWYPRTQFAADVALLVFLAWLLAFGTHDLTHALQRSRAAMSGAHRRLHGLRQRLAVEIRQHMALKETFDHERFHDAFTGLPNRRYFMDRLDRALRELRTRQRAQFAVLVVDIVRFKLVNDMLGHTAGDELMVQAAARFEQSTDHGPAVLARWSGDQFMLMMEVSSREEALAAARRLLEQLNTPFQLRRHRLMVRASVGITCVDSGQQRAEEVVREADIALTVGKRQGLRVVLYSASMAGQTASLVSLEADLHLALENRELRLLYQPIVDLQSHCMVGAEALLRWRHPVENLLTPERFLQIAEDAGLMVPITRWVLQRAVKLAREWQRRLPQDRDFFISVNLSAAALRDPGLVEYVRSLLRDNGVAASLLKLEVTEATLISNVGAARTIFDQLHALGLQIMLDDFGTGFSSLSYLQLFPFDYVKIDRPFVNRAGSDTANTGMMAALVQMARSLNLTAVAELIETEEAAKSLLEMGCRYGQGYYFSEPIEAEMALRRLLTQEPFEPRASSETMTLPELSEDNSPTLLIPAESMGRITTDQDS